MTKVLKEQISFNVGDESDHDVHSHSEPDIEDQDQLDKFNFNQVYQDFTDGLVSQKQAYYVSLLDEIQEEEFINEEYIGEVNFEGEKINQGPEPFKYDFPLSGINAYYTPELLDVFDMSAPKEINAILQEQERRNRNLGQVACISVCDRSLAIGFKYPSSLIIWNDIKFDSINHREIYLPLNQLGDLICIDFYFDAQMLVAGFSTGIIAFIDTIKGSLVQSFQEIHSHALICIKFLHRIQEEQLVTITTDVNGTASLANFKKSFFTYEISPLPLLKQMSHPGNTIQVLSPTLQEKYLKTYDVHINSILYTIQINTVTRFAAVMNQDKLWICMFRIPPSGAPELFILQAIENPFKMFKEQIFNNCCGFGEGFLKRKDANKEIKQQLLLVGCWQTQFFFIRLEYFHDGVKEHKHFDQSQFIDFNSRVLCLNFLQPSLCILITKTKGVILINTVNLPFQKENMKSSDIHVLNFPDSQQFNYINQEIVIPNFILTSARKKFRNAVISLLRNKSKYQENTEEEIVGNPQMFNQSFSTNQEMLVVLHQKGVRFAKIAGWEKLMIQFYKFGEWLYGMHYLVSIYIGSNRVMTRFLNLAKDERRNQIFATISDITTRYHTMIMECIKFSKEDVQFEDELDLTDEYSKNGVEEAEKTNKILFSILIEFLITTECYDLLFESIMPKTLEILNDNNNFFIACLQPFLVAKKVKYIPEQQLIEITKYFMQNNQIEMIYRLSLSLDPKLVDTSFLMKACLKIDLIKPVAIICSQGDPEMYLTPLVKIWSAIINFVDKQEFETASYFIIRALSYIKMTLKKKNIRGQIIENDRYHDIVINISLWFINFQNLEKMLFLQPCPTFEVIKLFFSNEIQNIINPIKLFQPDEHIVKTLKYNLMQADWIYTCNTNARKFLCLINEVVNHIVYDYQAADSDFKRSYRSKSLQYEGEENANMKQVKLVQNDIEMQFQLLLLRLYVEKQIPIHCSKIIQSLSYTFKNLTILDYLYLSELVSSLAYWAKEEVRTWPDQKEALEFLKSEYVVNVIKELENDSYLTSQDKLDLSKLDHDADLTNLTTVSVYLAQMKKDFLRACNFYLKNSSNQLIKGKIFVWLFKTMEILETSNDKKEKEQFEILRIHLIDKLTDFIKINSEKTREIVARFHKDAEKQVIEKLVHYPTLQLEYVENVLKKEREAGRKVETDFLVLQIELLCRFHPEKILPELKTYEYPLDNILLLCRQYKRNEATAYVLERLGSIQEAVSYYVDIFKENIKTLAKEISYEHDVLKKVGSLEKNSILGNIFKLKQGAQRLDSYQILKEKVITQFQEEVKKIINVCLQNNKFDSQDEIWYILLDNIIDLRDNIIQQKESEEFIKDLCTEAICTIIATIAKNSNLEILLQQLQSRYTNLDMGQLKMTFQEIISNYLYVENILINSRGLIQEDLVIKIKSLQTKYKRGIISRGKCQECHIELNLEGSFESEVQDVVIFLCGHGFHRGCVVEQQNLFLCQICCARNEEYAYNILFINSKIKLDKLTENLKKRQKQATIQRSESDSSRSESQELENLMNAETFLIKPTVSKDTEMKRQKRTNKLRYFDRKRCETVQVIDETTDDIESFFKNRKK